MRNLLKSNKNKMIDFAQGVFDILVRVFIVLLFFSIGIFIITIMPYGLIHIASNFIVNPLILVLYWIIVPLILIIPQIYVTFFGLMCMIMGIKIASNL